MEQPVAENRWGMAIGLHLGIKGKQGGWLYQGEKVLCQGWFAAMTIWNCGL